jgi:anti-sigma factor RsiW
MGRDPEMTANFDPDKSMAFSDVNRSDSDGLDRFELLSAYLDGEVTAAERREVEAWLASDATAAQLHSRLLKLRRGFQALPTPAPSQPVELAITQVFKKIDQRPRLTVLLGGAGAAAAAVLVAAVSGVMPGMMPGFSPSAQVATGPAAKTAPAAVPAAPADGLLVALDEPVLIISKTAVADDNSPANNPAVRNADLRNSQQ